MNFAEKFYDKDLVKEDLSGNNDYKKFIKQFKEFDYVIDNNNFKGKQCLKLFDVMNSFDYKGKCVLEYTERVTLLTGINQTYVLSPDGIAHDFI